MKKDDKEIKKGIKEGIQEPEFTTNTKDLGIAGLDSLLDLAQSYFSSKGFPKEIIDIEIKARINELEKAKWMICERKNNKYFSIRLKELKDLAQVIHRWTGGEK